MPPHLDPDKIVRMQAFLGRQTAAASEATASEAAASEAPDEDAFPDPVPAAPTVATPPTRQPLRLKDELTHEGLTLSVKEWSARRGIPASTILYRIKTGFPVEQALHVGNLPRKRRSTRHAPESP